MSRVGDESSWCANQLSGKLLSKSWKLLNNCNMSWPVNYKCLSSNICNLKEVTAASRWRTLVSVGEHEGFINIKKIHLKCSIPEGEYEDKVGEGKNYIIFVLSVGCHHFKARTFWYMIQTSIMLNICHQCSRLQIRSLTVMISKDKAFKIKNALYQLW